jgi:DNA-binding response OmpR family regulator
MPEIQNKPKALLVEDEFLIAIAMQELLGNLGYEVVGPARGLDEANWLIDQHSDLVVGLLDVHLGDEMVWPVARSLIERSVPILLVTGDVAIHSQVPPDLSTVKILLKPFGETDLDVAIRAVLGRNLHGENNTGALLG